MNYFKKIKWRNINMKIKYIKIENFRGIKSLVTHLEGNFICLIGHGDNCKSTILTAIELALSSRWNIAFDDSDFYNQISTEPISISITLTDWNEEDEKVKRFFSENKFGQFIGGYINGPTEEPIEDGPKSITINLLIDKELEPKWTVIKGAESKPITSSERTIFGLGRIDNYLDNNFTWSKSSLLTKLSSDNTDNLNSILTDITRNMRDQPQELTNCTATAARVRNSSKRFGVNLTELKPKLDIQKISLASGSLALHRDSVPLRSLGTGSKKLISCSMQMTINNGNSITLIDEIELGLEPHRIRGLIKNLKETNQQVITTTHSPVVLKELTVASNELYTCKRNEEGTLTIKSLNSVANSQGPLRSNADAFLGRRIIVCEGATEIGLLRALDSLKSQGNSIPVWTLNTAYYNAGGIGGVKAASIALKELGYEVGVLCDNDAPTSFTTTDMELLTTLEIPIFIWEEGNSTEKQFFQDLKWEHLENVINTIAENHDSKDLESLKNAVTTKVPNTPLAINQWPDTVTFRSALGDISSGKKTNGESDGKKAWFKRIDYAEELFKVSIPHLIINSHMSQQLENLWIWVQRE